MEQLRRLSNMVSAYIFATLEPLISSQILCMHVFRKQRWLIGCLTQGLEASLKKKN